MSVQGSGAGPVSLRVAGKGGSAFAAPERWTTGLAAPGSIEDKLRLLYGLRRGGELAAELLRAGGMYNSGPKEEPRLLDRVRESLRVRHMSYRTEQAYVHWIRRYILFHGKRHPQEMGEGEVNAFLTHLAVEKRVSASTQTQALCALVFLYRTVLDRELGELDGLIRARRRRRLPSRIGSSQV